MVVFVMKMISRPEKSLELRQTLEALMTLTRKDKGCLSHNVFKDIEDDNILSLVEVWENQDDLNRHLRSDRLTVLMGTTSLMAQPPEIMISEVSVSSGWEAIEAVRD